MWFENQKEAINKNRFRTGHCDSKHHIETRKKQWNLFTHINDLCCRSMLTICVATLSNPLLIANGLFASTMRNTSKCYNFVFKQFKTHANSMLRTKKERKLYVMLVCTLHQIIYPLYYWHVLSNISKLQSTTKYKVKSTKLILFHSQKLFI